MARVVVVGAGMGGLAAAARLSAQGHEVTVCEQADVVGGKLGWFERDGFGFDTGPSLLTLPAVYRDLFLKTGPALGTVVEPAAGRPGVPLPVRRRHLARACRTPPAGGSPQRSTTRSAGARVRSGRRSWTAPA
ncbi:hypothetical protein GCM10025868_43820 [Angustibacter aerolatus]|uniref:Amine oxidase domain-containing protein n=1 Tax=Angustibacter aerolatus TaxID=1162965 RepID=A0ABQ6JQL4_9ACTN|nr:NAD(P)-binding protein [Angustibacter aerolatus]GMA89132.1 hypothetical protein GCM10025868_43820 [Angustibacter aerolatus]